MPRSARAKNFVGISRFNLQADLLHRKASDDVFGENLPIYVSCQRGSWMKEQLGILSRGTKELM